jgi:hypothetical protein
VACMTGYVSSFMDMISSNFAVGRECEVSLEVVEYVVSLAHADVCSGIGWCRRTHCWEEP